MTGSGISNRKCKVSSTCGCTITNDDDIIMMMMQRIMMTKMMMSSTISSQIDLPLIIFNIYTLPFIDCAYTFVT